MSKGKPPAKLNTNNVIQLQPKQAKNGNEPELDPSELDIVVPPSSTNANSTNHKQPNQPKVLLPPISCDEARNLPPNTPANIYIPEKYASRLDHRQELTDKWEWLVDQIINVGSLHLVAGPSGAGKTRWLLQFMYDWSRGEPILGFMSNPKPYIYLSCDRGMGELNQTLHGLGFQDWDIPAFSVEELSIRFNLEHPKITLEELPNIFPWCKVFFIEAIGWFLPSTSKGNGYNETIRYWGGIREIYEEKGLTLIGTTHSPKQTVDRKYSNPRDRVIGSVGWPAIASTIILIDPDETVKNRRHLSILPRNSADHFLMYEMNDKGQMVMIANETEQEQAKKVKAQEELATATLGLDAMLNTLAVKGVNSVHVDVFKTCVEQGVCSRATLFRWITEKIDQGRLRRLRGGNYQIMPLQ